MVFYPPEWVPKLPFDPPDTVPITDFIFNEEYGRHPLHHARDIFKCGISGKTYSAEKTKERVDYLARGIAKELGWAPNSGSEWDKVAGLFSYNTIDSLTVSWAVLRLGGVSTPANAGYSAEELEHQIRDSGAKCVFTCQPLLDTTLEVVKNLGIAKERVYILEMPTEATEGKKPPREFKTVDDLIALGHGQPEVESLKWEKGQGAKQTAFLCYSSGTSGLPKGVMISHRNVITNTLQLATFDTPYRNSKKDSNAKFNYQENCLGLLPFSHIYGLVVIAHYAAYQGDSIIVLPVFKLDTCLSAVQNYKINTLFIVPPIIINFTKNPQVLSKYDLSSVATVFTGAAPLGAETAEDLQKLFPKWIIRQGYGLTETCTAIAVTSHNDVWFGSSGSLLPGFEGKVMSIEGVEITRYDEPGELWAKSPTVVLGYLNNEKATKETFVDGYMRTGDEVVFRKGPNGHEHMFIVDRIKELIKVKGLQVAPAELESFLLTHPSVADCAVIAVPHESSGEVPKAFVVKSASSSLEDNEKLMKRDIQKYVEKSKARHKWLRGGVEFVDVIPKSPSGKILRRLLRDQERERRRKEGAKL